MKLIIFMYGYLQIYPTLCSLIVVVISFSITLFAIPSILHIARRRHLYDDIGHFRKQHDHGIPRLGGVAIFMSFTITTLLFGFGNHALPVNYLIVACIIMFAMGLKDDLSGVNSKTKFFIQFIAATILVLLGDIRLSSMYGVFGLYDLPYWPSAALTILVIMLVINSFNLIDGIDGLAATTGILANATFAALFLFTQHYQLAIISLCMTGAILGFLKFNLTPAKLFMGDTGALLIGLISAIMAIKFIELNKMHYGKSNEIFSAPSIAIAILIVPIFDTLRIFMFRAFNGISPFTADRNHTHHRMLALGLSHLQTTLILLVINFLFIMMVFFIKTHSNGLLITIMALVALCLNGLLTFQIRLRNNLDAVKPLNAKSFFKLNNTDNVED